LKIMPRLSLRFVTLVIAAAGLGLWLQRSYPVQTSIALILPLPLATVPLLLAPVLVLNHPGFRSRVLGGRKATRADWFVAWLQVASILLLLLLVAVVAMMFLGLMFIGDPVD